MWRERHGHRTRMAFVNIMQDIANQYQGRSYVISYVARKPPFCPGEAWSFCMRVRTYTRPRRSGSPLEVWQSTQRESCIYCQITLSGEAIPHALMHKDIYT